MAELWDVYTRDKVLAGKTRTRGAESNPGEYHLVVVSLIFNNKSELLMTKRSKNKIMAGMWETTAGSVISGETSVQAMKREIEEEIGITIDVKESDLIHSFIYDSGIFDVYYLRENIELQSTSLQVSEVDEIAYVEYRNFRKMFKQSKIVPNLDVIMELRNMGIISFK